MTPPSEELTRTLQDLVRIDSINPTLVPGAAGESAIAAYVSDWLRTAGLDVTLHEPAPGRPSVVGRLRGTGGGRTLMLNAHMDTVGVAGIPEPFSGRVRDGKLYGRGAYDMKGSLAACLVAAKRLKADPPLRGDLLVAGVADEEDASLGTRDLVTRYRIDAAIVTEPTQLDVCLAHKGFCWIEVTTHGRAAHGSRYQDGVDANLRMGRVLSRLERLERELRERRRPHPLVGPPSLHAALVQGGTGASTYAAECRLVIERRTIPGETADQVLAEVQTMVNQLRLDDSGFQASVRLLLDRDPFEVPPDAEVVRLVRQAATRVRGRSAALIGDTPWMDSALLAAAGAETVVVGPSGAGAHSAEEWVDLQSVADLAEILVQTAREYLG
ncbi:MAG: ArgE/DapE family deacylase [Gemmatimonadales bacterium]